MMTNLKKRKHLFKTITQLANNSSGHEEDEPYSTEVDGQMHSEDAKITVLIGAHLQTK
jgi:hypothetical protein